MTLENITDGSGMTQREREQFEMDQRTRILHERYSPPGNQDTCLLGNDGLGIWNCNEYGIKDYCTANCPYAIYRKSLIGRVRTFLGL